MASPQVVSPAMVAQQQSWILQQFNGTTYSPNAMDVQHEPLYDTLVFDDGAQIPNNTQFFTNPANKTLAQTNVTTAKRLDAPEAFAVMGIGLRVAEDVLLADLIAFFGSAGASASGGTSSVSNETAYALEFWIGQKEYNRAPVWFYNVGSGADGFSVVSGQSAITNGRPGKGDRHELAINIVIDNQASFYGQLVSATSLLTLTAAASGGTGITLVLILDGLHARGVQ